LFITNKQTNKFFEEKEITFLIRNFPLKYSIKLRLGLNIIIVYDKGRPGSDGLLRPHGVGVGREQWSAHPLADWPQGRDQQRPVQLGTASKIDIIWDTSDFIYIYINLFLRPLKKVFCKNYK